MTSVRNCQPITNWLALQEVRKEGYELLIGLVVIAAPGLAAAGAPAPIDLRSTVESLLAIEYRAAVIKVG